MQIAKINNQIYSNNRQNSNQSNPTFGVSLIADYGLQLSVARHGLDNDLVNLMKGLKEKFVNFPGEYILKEGKGELNLESIRTKAEKVLARKLDVQEFFDGVKELNDKHGNIIKIPAETEEKLLNIHAPSESPENRFNSENRFNFNRDGLLACMKSFIDAVSSNPEHKHLKLNLIVRNEGIKEGRRGMDFLATQKKGLYGGIKDETGFSMDVPIIKYEQFLENIFRHPVGWEPKRTFTSVERFKELDQKGWLKEIEGMVPAKEQEYRSKNVYELTDNLGKQLETFR